MSVSAQMDRIVAAYAADNLDCQCIRGRNVTDQASWLQNVQNNRDAGKGGARNLIYSVRQLTQDPDALKFCGTWVMVVSCGFAAVRKTANEAQDALETWIAKVYKTAGGVLGAPSAWPIEYPAGNAAAVTFRACTPEGGVVPVEPLPFDQSNGSIWVASCPMRLSFLTS